MSETMGSREIIEIGLGSIGKIRIIKALAEESKLATVYVLHKKTRLKRDDIKNNLDDLMKIGWVKQSKYANVMYCLNRENKYVIRLVEFFNDAGYTDQP
jgi:hypothetical protein